MVIVKTAPTPDAFQSTSVPGTETLKYVLFCVQFVHGLNVYSVPSDSPPSYAQCDDQTTTPSSRTPPFFLASWLLGAARGMFAIPGTGETTMGVNTRAILAAL